MKLEVSNLNEVRLHLDRTYIPAFQNSTMYDLNDLPYHYSYYVNPPRYYEMVDVHMFNLKTTPFCATYVYSNGVLCNKGDKVGNVLPIHLQHMMFTLEPTDVRKHPESPFCIPNRVDESECSDTVRVAIFLGQGNLSLYIGAFDLEEGTLDLDIDCSMLEDGEFSLSINSDMTECAGVILTFEKDASII